MKLKIGDRVAVGAVDYYLNKRKDGKGTVTSVDTLIEVEMDRWDPPGKNLFHPKQCRPLKKRSLCEVTVQYNNWCLEIIAMKGNFPVGKKIEMIEKK